MRRVLLDTDILSEVLKQKHLGVAEKARAYLAVHGRLTLSAVSVMEIVYGLRRVGRHDRADQFATSLVGNDVLDLDIEAGLLAGTVNAELERRGRPIGVPDVMIAAIALRHGLPIVTGNVSHYEAIRQAGFALSIENWREP